MAAAAQKGRAAPQLAIKKEGLLWFKASEAAKENERKAKSRESFTFILGQAQSGKSSILNRLILNNNFEAGPGYSPHYGYRTGQTAANLDKQDVAHMWEISGSDEVVTAFANRVMLQAKQLATGAVIVTVDLSKPREAIPTLLHNIRLIRERVSEVFKPLEQAGHKLPQQLRQRAKTRYLDTQRKQNPDGAQIDFIGIQLVILATKHDALKRQLAGHPKEQDLWAVLGHALRCIAHQNGASLAYVGALGAGSDAMSSLYQQQQDLVKLLCDFVAFYDPPVTSSQRILLSVRPDPSSLVFMPAGCDSFSDIRAPPGCASSSAREAPQAWEGYINQTFPEPEEKPVDKKEQLIAAKRVGGLESTTAYAEDVIDDLLKAKAEQHREHDRRAAEAAKEEEERRTKLRQQQLQRAKQAAAAKAAASVQGQGGAQGGA